MATDVSTQAKTQAEEHWEHVHLCYTESGHWSGWSIKVTAVYYDW